MESISEQLKNVLAAAGVKPRSAAILVGCHFTTIYNIIRSPETIPVRVMQERIYDVIEFLNQEVKSGRLPDNSKKSNKEKTRELKDRFDSRILAV